MPKQHSLSDLKVTVYISMVKSSCEIHQPLCGVVIAFHKMCGQPNQPNLQDRTVRDFMILFFSLLNWETGCTCHLQLGQLMNYSDDGLVWTLRILGILEVVQQNLSFYQRGPHNLAGKMTRVVDLVIELGQKSTFPQHIASSFCQQTYDMGRQQEGDVNMSGTDGHRWKDRLLFNRYQSIVALLVFSYLIFLTVQWYWYYQPQVADEETEAQIIVQYYHNHLNVMYIIYKSCIFKDLGNNF